VSGGSVLIRLIDGDVQPVVAHGVAGVVKAPGVTELGQERDRRQRPETVDLIDQRAAAGLRAGIRAQRKVDRADLHLDRVDRS
jgi:hypothetical protein